MSQIFAIQVLNELSLRNTLREESGLFCGALTCRIVPALDCFIETVVFSTVPARNVLSMLFQEGRSSNFRLRQGVGQATHTQNNSHVKCTGVYFV